MLKRTIYIENKGNLTFKSNQLSFITSDKSIKRVPIEDIAIIVIDNPQILITIPLINALIENNVALVFCNNKHLPTSMLLNLDGNDVQTELFTYQINATEPLKKNIWKQVIASKIKNQAALLKKLDKPYLQLANLANTVKSGDTTNREALAAKIYWKSLFGDTFTRERHGEPPNMLLNYGYIILRAALARGLIGSGLLPTLGIFHHNRYNSYCLADDIMEPYRPFIDEKVFELFHNNPENQILEKTDKLNLLSLLAEDVYINKLQRPLMVAISNTTASLARYFAGKTKKINLPVLN